jgi:hypothetical protein
VYFLEEKEQLTEEQVNQVLTAYNFLEFSNSYKESYYNNGQYFTPDIINQRMKDINMSPVEATLNGLQEALKNPKDNETLLKEYSMYAENNSMYYKRLIRYFSDMAAFHISFDCINIQKDSDFNSKQYKEDLKVLDNFISRFNCKEEFQKVLRQMLRQGVFYAVLRKDSEKYSLQELPADFCKITGRHPYGLLFDFNMEWFTGNYGVDIDMYPKVFKKMYRDVFNDKGYGYDPAQKVSKRSSVYTDWRQCSPLDGFWAWKMSPEIATITPYFSPLFPNISYAPVIRGLQNDKYFIEASKLLVGIIGFNKDTKSGQVANQMNITPDALGKFLGVARKGLNKQIGLVALPMDSIETVDFDTDSENIEIDSLKNIASQSVSSYDVLYGNQKLNSHQSKLASAVDSNIVNAIYEDFANFVTYYVNLETKKFKFKIRFHDINVPDDQARVSQLFKDYAQIGVVDAQLAARALDMNPFELMRHMDMTKSMGFDKKLISLVNLNTQSSTGASANKPGRPSNPMSDNDNTSASWERGSNDLK